ncbi:hypothetical protein FOZ63_024870, partial [Perkinsus olseni]
GHPPWPGCGEISLDHKAYSGATSWVQTFPFMALIMVPFTVVTEVWVWSCGAAGARFLRMKRLSDALRAGRGPRRAPYPCGPVERRAMSLLVDKLTAAGHVE